MFYLLSKRPTYSNVLTANYYIAPNGNDSNSGTITQPFRSIEKACSVASPGNLIYVRGGRYYPLTPTADPAMDLTNVPDGTAANPIRIWAYPGETPIIDLSTVTHSGTSSCAGFKFSGNWWHWKGFECTGMPQFSTTAPCQSFWFRECNNVTIENCKVHDNFSMGLSLGAYTGAGYSNRIINCDCYRNKDAGTTSDPYGNADGIHITIASKDAVNYVTGCRVWENSDDGFDSFHTDGIVYISNCIAYRNGYIDGTETLGGDGNGFKFGQGETTFTDARRIVTNCISTKHPGMGFDGNGETWPIYVYNCTAYSNGPTGVSYGFRFVASGAIHRAINCLAYNNRYTGSVGTNGIHNHNSWDSSVTVTDADFQSLDFSKLLLPRKANGYLQETNFLRLAAGSDLIGAGSDLGYGTNIGAF